MSAPTSPEPVKLFFAILAAPDAPVEELERRIGLEFGEIDARLEAFDFDPTDYYNAEMGPGLRKSLIACGPLIDPSELVSVKLHTNRLERHYAGQGGGERTVNIDPGYLDLARVVLATGKDCAHRIYVGRGIYAETTLIFSRTKNGYEPQAWTYPDYRQADVIGFFQSLRDIFHDQRRERP